MAMEEVSSVSAYQQAYKKSVSDTEGFWSEVASDFLWKKKWDKVLEWNFEKPEIKWFVGGKLNITENCIDRHLSDHANKTAIIWEPSDPKQEAKKITYRELHEHVCQVGN